MKPISRLDIVFSPVLKRRVVWDCDLDANGVAIHWYTSRRSQEAYALGETKPRYPMPSLTAGVSIQPHIVDVIGPKQTRSIDWETDDYISMDHEGWTPTLMHWWSNER